MGSIPPPEDDGRSRRVARDAALTISASDASISSAPTSPSLEDHQGVASSEHTEPQEPLSSSAPAAASPTGGLHHGTTTSTTSATSSSNEAASVPGEAATVSSRSRVSLHPKRRVSTSVHKTAPVTSAEAIESSATEQHSTAMTTSTGAKHTQAIEVTYTRGSRGELARTFWHVQQPPSKRSRQQHASTGDGATSSQRIPGSTITTTTSNIATSTATTSTTSSSSTIIMKSHVSPTMSQPMGTSSRPVSPMTISPQSSSSSPITTTILSAQVQPSTFHYPSPMVILPPPSRSLLDITGNTTSTTSVPSDNRPWLVPPAVTSNFQPAGPMLSTSSLPLSLSAPTLTTLPQSETSSVLQPRSWTYPPSVLGTASSPAPPSTTPSPSATTATILTAAVSRPLPLPSLETRFSRETRQNVVRSLSGSDPTNDSLPPVSRTTVTVSDKDDAPSAPLSYSISARRVRHTRPTERSSAISSTPMDSSLRRSDTPLSLSRTFPRFPDNDVPSSSTMTQHGSQLNTLTSGSRRSSAPASLLSLPVPSSTSSTPPLGPFSFGSVLTTSAPTVMIAGPTADHDETSSTQSTSWSPETPPALFSRPVIPGGMSIPLSSLRPSLHGYSGSEDMDDPILRRLRQMRRDMMDDPDKAEKPGGPGPA